MTVSPLVPPIRPESHADGPAVDALIARAFGPGRYAKAAERLREGNRPRLDLSFVAWVEGRAVGCVRLWPVTVGQARALLLGPFAVDEAYQSNGLGAALIRHACEAARQAGEGLIFLVGDELYYGPLGFAAAPARSVTLPGPVDQRRVLAWTATPGSVAGLAGKLVAAPPIPRPAADAALSASGA